MQPCKFTIVLKNKFRPQSSSPFFIANSTENQKKRPDTMRNIFPARRFTSAIFAFGLVLILGVAQSGWAQTGTNPCFSLFKNYFVTGDYVVGGWIKAPADGEYKRIRERNDQHSR